MNTTAHIYSLNTEQIKEINSRTVSGNSSIVSHGSERVKQHVVRCTVHTGIIIKLMTTNYCIGYWQIAKRCVVQDTGAAWPFCGLSLTHLSVLFVLFGSPLPQRRKSTGEVCPG